MQELALQKCVPHRDFYNIRKVTILQLDRVTSSDSE